MDIRPIGFFDSGVGGISVLRSALAELPTEDYIFYGDNKNAPYGDKTEAEITTLTIKSADHLVSRGVKAIVLACNTATGTCIRQIREKLDVPVISVEPAIKPACAVPGTGHILMLATLATTRLSRYLALQNRMPDPQRVVNVPCPGLVDRIEQGVWEEADAFDDLLDGYLKPYWGWNIDGIVLGCTHYIFIKNAIARYAAMHFTGPCTLYDGNDATAKQLHRVLTEHQLLSGQGTGKLEFITSGDRTRIIPLFDALLRAK